jgi:thiamine transport system permease protein
MASAKTIRVFLIALFLAPYLLLLTHWSHLSLPSGSELLWIFKNSLLQSVSSAALAMALGFWWARGLLFLEQKLSPMQNRLLEFLILLPNFLPALFILLILLSVITPFPFGLYGVIIVHGLMNASLAALFLKDILKKKLRPMAELCWVEGVGQISFWKQGFRYLQSDFIWLFAFIFILCFCSFAIPLIAGGGKVTTFEVAIYEKIRTSADWSQAVGLSYLQFVFLLLFAFLPSRHAEPQRERLERAPYLKSISGGVSALAFSIFWIGVFLWQSVQGFTKLSQIDGLWRETLLVIPLSLILSLGVGFGVLGLLLLSAYVFPDSWLKRFFLGFVAPSTALLGFVFLFLPSWFSGDEFLKWVIAFVILIFAPLYRWGWVQRLESLRGQVQVAGTMGAGRRLIFCKITLPQVLDLACRLSAVASLWALGDFALAKMIISRPATLALIAESLMSSYRIEGAMAVTALILLFGFVLFLIFRGVENVIRRKFA